MTEDRWVELETRLAYQEETLQVLNDVITRQQRQIDQLETLCRQLLDRVAEPAEFHRHGPAEEVPPHY